MSAAQPSLHVIRGAESVPKPASDLCECWSHRAGCIGRVAIVRSRAKESVVDLNEAIRKHARWKTWFQQAVSAGEPLDVAILAKDNQCDLGKWLYGEAQSLYGMRPSHALCLTRHAAIHVEAAKVAAVLNAQCRDEAQRMLADGRSFSLASSAFILALIELENQAAAERDRLPHAPVREFGIANSRQAGEFC